MDVDEEAAQPTKEAALDLTKVQFAISKDYGREDYCRFATKTRRRTKSVRRTAAASPSGPRVERRYLVRVVNEMN